MRKYKPAKIITFEAHNGYIICSIAAFRINHPDNRDRMTGRRCAGQLAFRCPFCGDIHYLGTVHQEFGKEDGHISSRCPQSHQNVLNSRGYILVETKDPVDAGDLPKQKVKAALNFTLKHYLAERRRQTPTPLTTPGKRKNRDSRNPEA